MAEVGKIENNSHLSPEERVALKSLERKIWAKSMETLGKKTSRFFFIPKDPNPHGLQKQTLSIVKHSMEKDKADLGIGVETITDPDVGETKKATLEELFLFRIGGVYKITHLYHETRQDEETDEGYATPKDLEDLWGKMAKMQPAEDLALETVKAP